MRTSRIGSESGGVRSENLVVVKALFGFVSSFAIEELGPFANCSVQLLIVWDQYEVFRVSD